ncbi:MAG TPA: N-acetylmuramoyl-L-alanine amidase [Tepidisphaeraceae bacterium]
MSNRFGAVALVCVLLGVVGCSHQAPVAQRLERKGDEIVVAGQLYHTGAPVVTWMDPGGFDAYRSERRFAPMEQASFLATTRAAAETKQRTGKAASFADIEQPERLDLRRRVLTTQQAEKFRGGGWDLKSLQDKVDQFVYHFDVTGTSSQCFFILHDVRGLSVHFMCDVDGTIYQTCDVKERAWHATDSNPRSIGIEIANIGAYSPGGRENPLPQWYRKNEQGRTQVVLPAYVMKQNIRKPGPYYPSRNEKVTGTIQQQNLEMYDLTDAQYDSLTKLTATLCSVLPKITCDYPREPDGKVVNHVLTQSQWENYQGLMGHFHVQNDKSDPGPAFNFERIRAGAWKLMSSAAKNANSAAKGNPVRFVEVPTTQPSSASARRKRQPLRPKTWPPTTQVSDAQ